MTILSYRSLALWLLGYPEAALADTNQALSDAREIGQTATLMYALAHAPLTRIPCGEYAAAKAEADELLALADDKSVLFWKAAGMGYEGWLFALTGKASDAVHMITSGRTAWLSTGATVFLPVSLSFLASAYAELGQFDEAWRCVDEAMTVVETTGERWWEAEINRVAGEIALKSSPSRMQRKWKAILSVPSRSPANNKPNPGNSAPR